jgi:putative hydrolase of the HAD superfamily
MAAHQRCVRPSVRHSRYGALFAVTEEHGVVPDAVDPISLGGTMIGCYVFDYGGVLARPQPTEDIRAMAVLTDYAEEVFVERYWRDRDAFDLAVISDREYWEAVLGRRAEPGEVENLNRLDVQSWSHPDEATLHILGQLGGWGARLALMSNAPRHLAAALDRLPWLESVEERFYSCRMGLAKPDLAAYRFVLDRLGTSPENALLVDDREVNVAEATRVGMAAVRFTGATELAGALRSW